MSRLGLSCEVSSLLDVDEVGSPAPLTEKRRGPSGIVLLWQEQEHRPGRQGLRAGAEFWLRPVLQEQEKLSGRQG